MEKPFYKMIQEEDTMKCTCVCGCQVTESPQWHSGPLCKNCYNSKRNNGTCLRADPKHRNRPNGSDPLAKWADDPEYTYSIPGINCTFSMASLDREGGYSQVDRTSVPRRVLERKLGKKLAKGECVRHLCHEPQCINPFHLIVGSTKDNSEDMVKAGRSLAGKKNHEAKLTAKYVDKIRVRYAYGNFTYKDLAELAGIKKSQVGNIINGKSWGPNPYKEAA